MALPQQNDPAIVQQPPHLRFHLYSPRPPPPPPSTVCQDWLQIVHDSGGPTPENGHSVSPAVHHESSSPRAVMAGGLNFPYNVVQRRKPMRASQVGLRSVMLSCPNLTNWFSGL